jgi:microcompartment protein CcmL/EutN
MSFPIKHPEEVLRLGTDWTGDLNTSETVTSATVVVSVKRGVDAASSSMLSGTPTINEAGNVVSQLIVGGVAGAVYETRWVVVTNQSRTLEERVTLVVE